MTHVVERCPSCGVEHEGATGGTCEACHAPLRPWCRRHGREAGWLAASTCPRCAEEAARPAALAPPVHAPATDVHEVFTEPSPAPAKAAPGKPPAKQPDGWFHMLVVMFLMFVVTVSVGAVLALIPDYFVARMRGGESDRATGAFVVGGAIAGVLYGILCCMFYVKEQRALRRARDAEGA